MRTSYLENSVGHNYSVFHWSGELFKFDMYWAYPRFTRLKPDYTSPYFEVNGEEQEWSNQPSEELKSLIQHSAPMEVIIDKLLEEYPQWEQPIMLAYGEHVRQQQST